MVRVRFAPSPTGYLHIGNARTALFNWLFARKHKKGAFILRIEDTDITRSKERYIQQIISDLRWLKLDWDEGPDIGGKFGPYKQSDRLKFYRKFAESLIRKGKAYWCYCSEESLSGRRKEALKHGRPPRYDNRCRNLRPEQIADFKAKSIKPCLRFRVPDQILVFDDLIRGRVSFDLSLLGDFVILKSDLKPAFNFAVTLDDILMKITHVIRGEDHLSNTPSHLLLFDALGSNAPKFGHISMTLGPGGGRLSKREQAVSISEYRRLGYLPEAVVNYLALLGWAPSEDRQILSRQELIKEFDISGMTKAGAIFDQKKLDWLGGVYIRKIELDRLTSLGMAYLKDSGLLEGSISEKKYDWLKEIVKAVRDHLSHISEIVDYAGIFFKEGIEIKKDEADLITNARSREVLAGAIDVLRKMNGLTKDNFKSFVKMLGQKSNAGGKDLYLPLRIAITGKPHGPELNLVLPVLGREKCIKRIKKAQEL
ncbi:MAG: glutamate--tRNA ligase [Candidatus Omnitrophota bacterium]|nr:glutamate--tRNA ligase [Candidatus Omnitrophota bacterium]